MLKHLPGIKWVGKLSLEDADLLAEYGSKSSSVLEFGVGGSTLILSQVVPTNNIICIEEDKNWLDLTKRRLDHLGTLHKVNLHMYGTRNLFNEETKFDFMFIDGNWETRLSFVSKHWKYLTEGGVMMYHDTTRQKYLADVQSFITKRFTEIDHAIINAPASNGKSSNITIVKKGKRPSLNWKYNEGKELWTYSEDRTVDPLQMWEYK